MASAARRRPFAQSHPDDKCGDGMWEAYLNVMEEEDSANVESWNGSTTGILTFTGLFAATVAAFLIESYKLLSPDTGAQAVTLLAQLVSMSDPNATLSVPAVDIQSGPFQVSQTAVVVNIFWFLSLIIALVCALLATLIQEWTREYLRDTQKRSQDMTIQEYALNHVFVCMGVERYGLDNVAFVIVALMHTAVTLFLVGLLVFLWPIHLATALVVTGATVMTAILYVLSSILSLRDNSCPYRTPLSSLLVATHWCWIVCRAKAKNMLVDHIHTRSLRLDDAHSFWVSTTRRHPVLKQSLNSRDIDSESDSGSLSERQSRLMQSIDLEQLQFIWNRVDVYVLAEGGSGAMLKYLPLRMGLIRDHSELRSFLDVLLDLLPSATDMVRHGMESLRDSSDAIGALAMLHRFITSKKRAKVSRTRLSRAMLTPSAIAKVDMINREACDAKDATMLIALTSLRGELLIRDTRDMEDPYPRSRLGNWRQRAAPWAAADASRPVRLRHQMNRYLFRLFDERKPLASEFIHLWTDIKGSMPLPLHSDDTSIATIEDHGGYQEELRREFARIDSTDGSARNILTLMAQFVLSPSLLQRTEGKFELDTPFLWTTVKFRSSMYNISYEVYSFRNRSSRSGPIERSDASPLFLSILHRAGLDDWREPGSHFESPELAYWSTDRSKGLRNVLLSVLRCLASRVTFPPMSDQELLSDKDFEEYGLTVDPTDVVEQDSSTIVPPVNRWWQRRTRNDLERGSLRASSSIDSHSGPDVELHVAGGGGNARNNTERMGPDEAVGNPGTSESNLQSIQTELGIRGESSTTHSPLGGTNEIRPPDTRIFTGSQEVEPGGQSAESYDAAETGGDTISARE